MRNIKSSVTAAIVLAASITSLGAYAGNCEIQFTRKACPGQEEVSYKKCDGKASCSEFTEAADETACKTLAMDACENKRLNITQSKVINAVFDGKALNTDSGKKDFCEEYPKRDTEFNQC